MHPPRDLFRTQSRGSDALIELWPHSLRGFGIRDCLIDIVRRLADSVATHVQHLLAETSEAWPYFVLSRRLNRGSIGERAFPRARRA